MQIKKVLPGLFLGLVFIAAFIFGISSFTGASAGSKTTITQPTPAGGSVLYSDPVPANNEAPAVLSTPVPVTTQPIDVANQTVEAAPEVVTTVQPVVNNTKAKEVEKPKKQEHESGEKEGDDD